MKKLFPVVLIAVAFALVVTLAGSPVEAKPSGTVAVQILALNDFHGNLLPPSGSSGRVGTIDAGGVEYLATHISNLRALNPNTVVVSAGDMIGASPLLSALFHDEPTIEAFNLIGLDFNAVGNHEFDEGVYELIRMQEGGCHPVDGCLDGDDFAGAEFRFLAANVTWKKTDKPIFPAYKIRSFEGQQIAFIGMTLEGTPSIVTPSGIAELNFKDEADTVNALVPELKQRGVETIVVLIHEGGSQNPPPGAINACANISGPIVDIVNRLDDEVDVVISGHTHLPYNCKLDGKLVTSAFSFGRLVTKIDLTLDRSTGDVTASTADNRIMTRDVPKASLLTALIDKYNAIAAPLANRVIGSITADITRTTNAAGESALGDVIGLLNTLAERLWRHVAGRAAAQSEGAGAPAEEGRRQDWWVVVEFLRDTDRDLLIRLSRKMLNHLCWNGIEEAQHLLQRFAPDRGTQEEVTLDDNRPVEKRTLQDLLGLTEETFRIAAAHLSQGEIVSRLQKWIKDDKTSFLHDALENPATSMTEMAEAMQRYRFAGVSEGYGMRCGLIPIV